jgi:hypothetical protein
MNKVETKMLPIGDDGPASAGAADRSFAGFLRTSAGQAACGEKLIARLMPSASTITSQNTLLKFARERWPNQFGVMEWRQPLPVSQAPFGSQRMKQVWAAFLSWAEGGQPS